MLSGGRGAFLAPRTPLVRSLLCPSPTRRPPARSLYLHPEALAGGAGSADTYTQLWRPRVEAVSALLDPSFEARLGYKMLELPRWRGEATQAAGESLGG